MSIESTNNKVKEFILNPESIKFIDELFPSTSYYNDDFFQKNPEEKCATRTIKTTFYNFYEEGMSEEYSCFEHRAPVCESKMIAPINTKSIKYTIRKKHNFEADDFSAEKPDNWKIEDVISEANEKQIYFISHKKLGVADINMGDMSLLIYDNVANGLDRVHIAYDREYDFVCSDVRVKEDVDGKVDFVGFIVDGERIREKSDEYIDMESIDMESIDYEELVQRIRNSGVFENVSSVGYKLNGIYFLNNGVMSYYSKEQIQQIVEEKVLKQSIFPSDKSKIQELDYFVYYEDFNDKKSIFENSSVISQKSIKFDYNNLDEAVCIAAYLTKNGVKACEEAFEKENYLLNAKGLK